MVNLPLISCHFWALVTWYFQVELCTAESALAVMSGQGRIDIGVSQDTTVMYTAKDYKRIVGGPC